MTFNILLHCQKPYMIEPQAVQFLLSHGFDFNKQYSKGLPYWPGNQIPKHKVRTVCVCYTASCVWRGEVELVNFCGERSEVYPGRALRQY